MSSPASVFFSSAMERISLAVLFACLIFNALIATAAAFPVLSSTFDPILLQPSNASLGSAELVTFTRLVLAVQNLGQDIPEEEVEDTLRAADRAISYEVQRHPDQRIPNDGFDYRRKDGNMLVLIVANIGEEISWNQLARVLQALYRYMTGGPGFPEAHYQALDFEIRTISHKVVGVGLVRYFPPDSSKAQRRALLSPSSLDAHETGLRMFDLPSAKNRTADSATVLSASIKYLIPNTPVTLIITSLGTRIPSFELGAGLTNALRRITFSAIGHAHDPIPENHYWYRDKVSRLWFNVLSITRHVITWQQLSWAVAGLLQWMENGNCRELAFEFEVVDEGIIGFGSVGYDPLSRGASTNTSGVEKRTAAANEQSLQLPGNTTVFSVPSPLGECTMIPDMGIQLCFRSFGLHITAYEVKRMFDGAFVKIKTLSRIDPEDRVPNNFFHYKDDFTVTGDSISITIQGSPRATILWIGLQKILAGLQLYMMGIRPRLPKHEPRYQVLAFDIITFGDVKMGEGWVRHTFEGNEIGSVERRTNANGTSQQFNSVAPSLPDTKDYSRVLISVPDLEFYFRFHGDAVSQSSINALFNQVFLAFPVSEDLVPGTSFHSRTPYSKIDGGTSLTIEWLPSYRMTYHTLHRVLLALQRYVDGDDDERPHWEDLGFELMSHGLGIGSGILWYVSGKVPSGKPGAEATAVPSGNLWLPTGGANSTLSPRYNSTIPPLQAPYPFPVPGSPITLSISRSSTPMWGIGMELFDLLAAASKEIGPVVKAHPTSNITQNTYKRSTLSEHGNELELNLHADKGHDISWQDLNDVLHGLDEFYSYDPDTGWYRSFASRFDISKAGKGRIGSGRLSLVGSGVA